MGLATVKEKEPPVSNGSAPTLPAYRWGLAIGAGRKTPLTLGDRGLTDW